MSEQHYSMSQAKTVFLRMKTWMRDQWMKHRHHKPNGHNNNDKRGKGRERKVGTQLGAHALMARVRIMRMVIGKFSNSLSDKKVLEFDNCDLKIGHIEIMMNL